MLDLSLGQKLFPVKSVLQNPIQSCTKNCGNKNAKNWYVTNHIDGLPFHSPDEDDNVPTGRG